MEEKYWNMLLKREGKYQFYYGVSTTAIYCHPTCASRLPKREHVAFFTSGKDAEKAGYRACKRCRPDQENLQDVEIEAVKAACRMMEEREDKITLEVLAAKAGFSPFHFHRMFKKIMGVTPKTYQATVRKQKLQQQLIEGEHTVTHAIYEAGFASSSRVYAQGKTLLGMTPATYKKRGLGEEMHFTIEPCFLGYVLIAATSRGIAMIELGDGPEKLEEALYARFPQATFTPGDTHFLALVKAVVMQIEHPEKTASLPLDMQGTAFECRIWQALKAIPAGKTMSYKQLAEAIGQPSSVRAVARACASNKLAVAIPCHRVVGSDGALRGYRWGIERKKKLLAREGEVCSG